MKCVSFIVMFLLSSANNACIVGGTKKSAKRFLRQPARAERVAYGGGIKKVTFYQGNLRFALITLLKMMNFLFLALII